MTPGDLAATAAPLLRPDPDPARDWVREELAKREYQPSLLERLSEWVFDLLGRMADAAQGLGRLSPTAAILVLVALLIFLAVVLARLRPDVRRKERTRTGAVLAEARVSAAEHRVRAERARAAGDHDGAVVEGMRAIAVSLVERVILTDDPGATAREVADAAGRAFPAHQARLRETADLFDGVRYGDHGAAAADADAVLGLEAELRASRPADEPVSGPVMAVPR